ASYAKPAVPVAALPGAAAAIRTSLMGKQPEGRTPTVAALQGAVDQARMLAMANAGTRVAVVLATDGFPEGCAPTDIPSVSAVADMANKGTPRIPTFVIGVFGPTPQEQQAASMNLNAIAQAGGTTKAFIVNTGMNVTQQFVTALNDIRTTALACEYRIPD